MIKLLAVRLLIILNIQASLHPKDTIIDSHYTWKELVSIFEKEYFDATKNNFFPDQKNLVRHLLDSDLVLMDVCYSGFDNKPHCGQIVCNKVIAQDLKKIFEEVLQLRFPIEQVNPVSPYDFTYNQSEDDNYSYCFDFRLGTGSNKLSNHSYGLAIDINPIQNPYKTARKTFPPNAKENVKTGRIRATDETGQKVIDIFKKHGWSWGGDWKNVKDYMHFQKP